MYKVLVVDDEEMICKAIESKIQRLVLPANIEVIMAFNGQSALEIAIACRPDIMITDICMPGMNGLELIKQVKDYGSKLGYYPNFIALSAYNEFDFVRQAFRLGVIDYLLKPVGLSDLQEVLEKSISSLQKNVNVGNGGSDQEYKQIMLENSLSRIFIEADVNEDIMNARIDQIKTYFRYDFFTIGMIDVRSEFGIKVPDEAITVLICEKKEILGDDADIIYLCDHKNMLTILFNYNTIDEYSRIILWLFNLYELLHEKFSKVFISTSGVQKDIHAAYCLYKQAYDALMYRIIYSDFRIIEFNSIIQKHNDCTFLLRRLDTLKQYAEVNNIHKMNGIIDDVFNKEILKITSIDDFRKLYAYAMHVINECYRINGRNDFIFTDLDEFYSLEDLCGFLNEQVSNINLHKDQSMASVVDVAVRYIKENYYKDINMAVVANIVNMDYSYFGKLFKKTIGVSFVDYITSVRMEKAIQLLSDPVNKVTEISKMLGYNNSKYFTRAFKAYFGASPVNFRRKQI